MILSSASTLGQTAAPNSDLATLKLKMVFYNRETFLAPCTADPALCGLGLADLKTSTELLKELPQFAGLDFVKASDATWLFVKDNKGKFPLFALYINHGSRITVNRDALLEAPFKSDANIDVFVEPVFSFLFFQTTKKAETSVSLAKKLAAFWGQKFKNFGLAQYKENRIEFMVFKNDEVQFMILDSYQSYVINKHIIKELKCDTGFTVSVITNYKKLVWTAYESHSLGANADAATQLNYECKNKAGEIQKWSADLAISLSFQGQEKKRLNQTMDFKVSNAQKEGLR